MLPEISAWCLGSHLAYLLCFLHLFSPACSSNHTSISGAGQELCIPGALAHAPKMPLCDGAALHSWLIKEKAVVSQHLPWHLLQEFFHLLSPWEDTLALF